MTVTDIIQNIESSLYTPPQAPKREYFPDGYIFDEEKSVRWNREEGTRRRQQYQDEIREYRKACGEMQIRFRHDIISFLKDEYHFNESESELIADKAYERGHSVGYYEVLHQTQELADFCEEFIAAGKEPRNI